VLTADELLTAAFSALLWRSPPTGFLPHCRLDSPLAAETPIVVDHRVQHEGAAAVLINLSPAPPPFFSRFERLVEIIGSDDDQTAAGRERWRYYKERGYALRSHSLGGRN
jgi:DNA polymerase-3 subunit chi